MTTIITTYNIFSIWQQLCESLFYTDIRIRLQPNGVVILELLVLNGDVMGYTFWVFILVTFPKTLKQSIIFRMHESFKSSAVTLIKGPCIVTLNGLNALLAGISLSWKLSLFRAPSVFNKWTVPKQKDKRSNRLVEHGPLNREQNMFDNCCNPGLHAVS